MFDDFVHLTSHEFRVSKAVMKKNLMAFLMMMHMTQRILSLMMLIWLVIQFCIC